MVEKNMAVMEREMDRELERLDPFRALDPLREFRLMPFGSLFEDVFAPLRADLPSLPTAWMPRADIRETEKEYIIDLSVPGIKKEDVKCEVKSPSSGIEGRWSLMGPGRGPTRFRDFRPTDPAGPDLIPWAHPTHGNRHRRSSQRRQVHHLQRVDVRQCGGLQLSVHYD